MAGSDPQNQLLTLIRDFATEKPQGVHVSSNEERRIVGLKKRILDFRSELDAANAELELSKRLKETTEQELKGYGIELAINESPIQILEDLPDSGWDTITGSDLEALKTSEFEEPCASLSEELQRRCLLPSLSSRQ